MNARHAARELVVFALPQIRLSAKHLENIDIEYIVEQAVRVIHSEVKELLSVAKDDILEADKCMWESTLHDNPVSIRKYLMETLSSEQKALELMHYCNELPILITLANRKDVKDYAVKLIKHYRDHRKELNKTIEDNIEGWTVDSLYSVDRSIIKVGLIEILYEKISPKIAINESIELAKKYGSQESSAFVNGILGKILENLNITTEEENE